MAGMGAAPKPAEQQRRRGRNLADQASTHLPAEGRKGKPPAWPLGKAEKRELELWTKLWRTPQAVKWEELGWLDVVARYARLLVVAERPDAALHAVKLLSEVRQMEDRLGLSPMSMLRLRWTIASADVPQQHGLVVDIRQRLKVAE